MSAASDSSPHPLVVTVRQDFVDRAGTWFREGESVSVLGASYDELKDVFVFALDGEQERNTLELWRDQMDGVGPGPGNLQPYFGAEGLRLQRMLNAIYLERQEKRNANRDWQRQAEELELAGRLEEAEQTIADAIPTLHYAIATAELYKRRWQRLKAAGDAVGAREARARATDWAYRFASMATSGGEGMALSRERDQFLVGLGPEEAA